MMLRAAGLRRAALAAIRYRPVESAAFERSGGHGSGSHGQSSTEKGASRWLAPTLAFGLFGSFSGSGGDEDPFADIDRIFEEFFSRSFQVGSDPNGQVYVHSWSSSDGKGSDPFIPAGLDPLFTAAATGDVAALARLSSRATEPHELGWQPIHVAAVHGQPDAIKALVAAGANPNAVDTFTSPMMVAEATGRNPREVVVARQQHFGVGLPQNYNFSGSTPLHYAVLGRSVAAVTALLELGADPGKANAAGQSALGLAKAARRPELVALLNDALKKMEAEVKRKEAEERRKFPLRMRLRQRLVGQEAAIDTVSSAIRRKENGWYDEDHPLVLLFLGSSGVGKTELAKQAALYLHPSQPRAFIRIDMSEFQHQHEVSKFIGSPPGYVGHEDGGQLTKQLREFPDAVVLFDEVEKAHPDILTILLQLFDEGRLTDGKGDTIECKKAIFVMTSNLASAEIADRAAALRKTNPKKESVMSPEFKAGVVQPILRRALRRDEFLGRINETVYFLPFSDKELDQLALAELNLWKERAWSRHGIELVWEDAVVKALAGGYNDRYGARSIKHEVELKVVNEMASAHEKEVIRPNCTVKLKLGPDGRIVLDVKDGTTRSLSLAELPKSLIKKLTSSV